MKKRHSYGATDNIILDYRLRANGKEYLQGDILQAIGPIRLFVCVQGMAPIRQIDVIENHEFRYSHQEPSHEVGFT